MYSICSSGWECPIGHVILRENDGVVQAKLSTIQIRHEPQGWLQK